MVRTIAIAAFWALAATCARAGEVACSEADTADVAVVATAPESFVGRCLRLRGILSGTPQSGATIAAVVRPGDTPASGLTVYLDGGNVPVDLSARERFVEITGRVLGCAAIRKYSQEAAGKADAAEKTRAEREGPGGIEVVYVHTPLGACSDRDDGFAILVSNYRNLPAPPPQRAPLFPQHGD